VTAYAYDPAGNVVSATDANGKTNQFAYDALNRLTNIAYADGSAVSYAYDSDGNRAAMADPHGTTVYSYDALDRLLAVTNPGGKVVGYAYDPAGNRGSLTYPDGKTMVYAYDRLNRLTSATDWLGKTTGYTYDPAGNLVQTQYPNRAGTAFGYDPANRLTQVVNSVFGLPLLNIQYALDKVGNRTSVSVDGVATAYAYDPLNELLSAQLGPLKTIWAYDPVGNRVKETSPLGTTAYAYDADDRLLTAGASAFSFDRNGNLVTKTSPGSAFNYAYDAANRLVRATGQGINSSFAYDGDGNRVSQSTAAGTYAYVNDVNAALPVVLTEAGPDGTITCAYGQGLIEEYSRAFNYFYHYDGLGSVVALTDAKGIPAAGYAYDAWGNALLTVPDAAGTRNKFRFTGEALDPGTGLYYLRARYYDPTVSRFISADPFRGRAAMPSTANRYGYTLGNPIRYKDPTGLAVEVNFAFIPTSNAFSTVAIGPATGSGVCQTTIDCISGASLVSDIAAWVDPVRSFANAAGEVVGAAATVVGVATDLSDTSIAPGVRAGRVALDVGLLLASHADPYLAIGVAVLDFTCTFAPQQCKAAEDSIINSVENSLAAPLSDPLPVTTPTIAPGVPAGFRVR